MYYAGQSEFGLEYRNGIAVDVYFDKEILMFYAVLVTDKHLDENIMAFRTRSYREFAHNITRNFGYNLINVTDTYVSNMPLQCPRVFKDTQQFRGMLSGLKYGE